MNERHRPDEVERTERIQEDDDGTTTEETNEKIVTPGDTDTEGDDGDAETSP
jgi:hypothetical protein